MSNLANANLPRSGSNDAAPSTKHRWRAARTVIRWLASAAIIAWLLLSTNWQNVWPAFGAASIRWLAVTAGIYALSQLASVLRWTLLVRAAGLTDSFGRLLAAYFEGMFVNVCLPTTLGGDLMKVFRVGQSQNKRAATATVMADRVSGLAALFVLLAIGMAMSFDQRQRTQLAPLAILMLLIGLPSLGWLLRKTLAAIEASPADSSLTLVRTVRAISTRLPLGIRLLIFRAPWTGVVLLAIVVQSLNVSAVWSAAHAIGVTIPVAGVLIAATTVSLAAAMPISIAGIGVREASLPLLLASYGVARESAVAIGLVWTATVLIVGLLGGPFHIMLQGGKQSAEQRTAVFDKDAARIAA